MIESMKIPNAKPSSTQDTQLVQVIKETAVALGRMREVA